ncbi:hypothetical protein [Acetobacterium carbinolicum]|uniref:hypothetical protein n=1 Tax=Acetobacterium carbinolicum TaxID=52690 RepID=UPI0039C9BB50
MSKTDKKKSDCKFEWIKNFEQNNNIEKTKNDNYKILIGEKAYLQGLNNKKFAVKVTKDSLYKKYKFVNIAFIVNDWIKIQDSLEMIFNLIFADSIRSLCILSYLRENHIDAEEFGIYLLENHKIILVNREKILVSNKMIYPYENLIKELEKKSNVQVLFVGGDLPKKKYTDKTKVGSAIHPSGVNLNFEERRERYYSVWYEHNNETVTTLDGHIFNMKNFMIESVNDENKQVAKK